MITATMLELSTGHLTERTCNTYLPVSNTAAYAKGEYGWFVYTQVDTHSMPDDLQDCVYFAAKHGFDWIMFDRDAEFNSELPAYNW